MKEIKKQIKKMVEETGKSEIECISAMQTACLAIGDNNVMEVLCKIKRNYIKKIMGV